MTRYSIALCWWKGEFEQRWTTMNDGRWTRAACPERWRALPKPKPCLGLRTQSGAAGPGAKVRPQPASLLPSLSYSSLARPLPPQDSPVMLSFGAGSRLISRAVRFQLAVLPVAARRLVSQFSDFPLHPTLLARIPHPSCTEVQEKTLPLLLDGVDVLAQVRTLLSSRTSNA